MNYPATGELADAEPGTLLITNVRPYGEGEPVSVLVTDGVITEVNQTVADSPETVNEDPAGSWFFKIQPSDPSALDEYLSEDEYKALID